MNIDVDDIISLTVELNAEGTGDSASLTLDNKDGKYDTLASRDVRFNKFYRICLGYSGQTVPVFTGRPFFLSVTRGELPATLSVTILERNSFVEKVPFRSEFLESSRFQSAMGVPMTVENVIRYFAKKYLGYTDGEIQVSGDFSTELAVFEVDNENPMEKLRNLALAFGGRLYNNADGDLCLTPLWTKNTPDITYTEDLIFEYGWEYSAAEDTVNQIEVIGRERFLDEVINTMDFTILARSMSPFYLFTYPYYASESNVMPTFRERRFLVYWGQDYCPSRDNGPSILMPRPDLHTFSADGEMECEQFDIVSLQHPESKGIPAGVDLKESSPKINRDEGEREYWKSVTLSADYEIHILGFTMERTFLRIVDKSGGTEPKHLSAFLGGYTMDRRFLIRKGVVYAEDRTYETWEEDSVIWKKNYWGKVIMVDSDGIPMSQKTGIMKKETLNLGWVTSDAQAQSVAENIAMERMQRQNRFRIKVPLNPLIERGDLVRAQVLENGVQVATEFYVDSIGHEYGAFSTTTIKGYIRDPNFLGWGGVKGAAETWEEIKGEEWIS